MAEEHHIYLSISVRDWKESEIKENRLKPRELSVFLCLFYNAFWTLAWCRTTLFLTVQYVCPPVPLYAGWSFSMGSAYQFHSWRVFVVVCALPCVSAVVALTFMPESPRFFLEVRVRETIIAISLVALSCLLNDIREYQYPYGKLIVKYGEKYRSQTWIMT